MGLFNKLKALRGDEPADAVPSSPDALKTPDLEWLPPQAPAPLASVPSPSPPTTQAPALSPSAAPVVAPPPPVPAATPVVVPEPAPLVPAGAPAPKPAPGTIPASLLKDLADKVGKLAKSTQAEQDAVKGFTDKVGKMEERVEKFQMLFEALSLKYNPFLGKEETEVFDGIQPDRVAKASNGHGAARLEGGREVVSSDVLSAPTHPPLPTRHDAHATNGNGHAHAAPAVAAPIALPVQGPSTPPTHEAPAIRIPVPPALGSRGASGGPRQAPWGGAAVQGTRESYLVLSWFEHMLESVDPPQIYRFLDYYLELGWITQEVHDWFFHLAVSVAPISDDARAGASAGRKPSPLELVRLHKTSLQFFDYLFRINLNPGEGRHLERVVDGLVEREASVMRKIARRSGRTTPKAMGKGSRHAAEGNAERAAPPKPAAQKRIPSVARKGERGRGV